MKFKIRTANPQAPAAEQTFLVTPPIPGFACLSEAEARSLAAELEALPWPQPAGLVKKAQQVEKNQKALIEAAKAQRHFYVDFLRNWLESNRSGHFGSQGSQAKKKSPAPGQ